MSMRVAAMGSVCMHMIMVVMVDEPVMGMVMAMVMGVAVMRAVGVNMVMVAMVTGVGLASARFVEPVTLDLVSKADA